MTTFAVLLFTADYAQNLIYISAVVFNHGKQVYHTLFGFIPLDHRCMTFADGRKKENFIY